MRPLPSRHTRTFSRKNQRWLRPPTTSPGSLLAIRTNRFASRRKRDELAELACQKTNYQEPAYLDTLAVAAAAERRFRYGNQNGAAGGRTLRCTKKPGRTRSPGANQRLQAGCCLHRAVMRGFRRGLKENAGRGDTAPYHPLVSRRLILHDALMEIATKTSVTNPTSSW